MIGSWRFGEVPGEPRVSEGTPQRHALLEVGGPVPRVEGAPLGGYAVRFDRGSHLQIPYEHTGDLNISGRRAQVSIFAVVRMNTTEKRGGSVAGMWSEGKGKGDDTGTRQYALLLDMPTYGGPKQVTPHVSSEGGASRRADGSMLPWCGDYAATPKRYPMGRWCSLGMTYDGDWLRAYLDGVAEPRTLDPEADHRDDPYFTREGPGDGGRGMNPYFHGRGIFCYDPALHAATKRPPSPFEVGAREVHGKAGSEPLEGDLAALVVFNRCLSPEDMLSLHVAAGL
ncbi:MAG: hypothetical protein ACFCVE_02745 [Phycisphaerae bacterium]